MAITMEQLSCYQKLERLGLYFVTGGVERMREGGLRL